MSRPNPEELTAVIEEVANAVQAAVGLTALLRQHVKTTADYCLGVDVAIARAVAALRRLQPPSGPGGAER